jgi:Zn-dependent M16 (insulinase) family peptidase
MEGPLFSGIRGKGLSYGCSIGLSLWTGVLQLDIYRASEPRKALVVFYDILEYMGTKNGFNDLCSEFNIDTARSMVFAVW